MNESQDVIRPKQQESNTETSSQSTQTQNEKPIDYLNASEIELIPVKQYFDIDSKDTSQDKYLQTILSWAKKNGFNDRSEMNVQIKKLELKLGAPEIGERRTVRIARYIELDNRVSGALREMQSLDRKA